MLPPLHFCLILISLQNYLTDLLSVNKEILGGYYASGRIPCFQKWKDEKIMVSLPSKNSNCTHMIACKQINNCRD